MARKEVNLFENYVDPRLEKRVREFISLHPLNNLETSPQIINLVKNTLIREMSDIHLEDLSWNYLLNNKHYLKVVFAYNIEFMYYLIDKGEFTDPQMEDILERRVYFETFSEITSVDNKFFENLNITPWSICYTDIYTGEGKFMRREYFFINNADKQMYDFIQGFIEFHRKSSTRVSFVHMTKILEFYKGDGYGAHFEDYDEKMFLQTFDEAIEKFSDDKANLVLKFYIWITSNQKDASKFPNYSYEVLRTPILLSHYKKRYVPVKYNPMAPVPAEDKWIVVKNDKHTNSQDVGSSVSFDFTRIINESHRPLIKEFYWKSDKLGSLNDLNKNVLKAVKLDNFLNNQEYTLNNILNYFVQNDIKRKTSYRDWLRFYNERKPIENFESLMIFLGNDIKDNKPRLDFYTVDQKKALIKAYKEYADSNTGLKKANATVCYYILLFLYYTSMRKESILKLKVDSLIEFAQGKYYFQVPSKTSSLGYEVYNATKLEAKIFKELIEYTEQFRVLAPTNIREYAFLVVTKNKKSVHVVSEKVIDNNHHRVCESSGIPYLPLTSSLRNSFMNEMTAFLEGEGENEFAIAKLTGHTLSVNEKHYVTRDLIEYSEKLYKTPIGNVPMIGQVQKETDLPDEAIVEGIGHCKNSECNLKSNLGCIACHNFIATINDIPAFEDDILELDRRIYEEDIQHEKEYLMRIRDIKANYLHQLYVLKELTNGTTTN